MEGEFHLHPRFSILIPVYNGEKFLPAAIQSVLAQTLPDFELLILDDGSTDHSLALARTMAEQDPRIRVFHQENAKIVISRRRLIDRARGSYLVWLDSDDLLAPGALEHMNQKLLESDADILFYRHDTISEEGDKQLSIADFSYAGSEKSDLLRLFCSSPALNTPWNKAFRRSLFDTYPSAEELPTLNIGEDKLMVGLTLPQAERFAYLDEILYHYRIFSQSVSHNLSGRSLLDFLKVRSILLARFREDPEFDHLYADIFFRTFLEDLSWYFYRLMRQKESGSTLKELLAAVHSHPVFLALRQKAAIFHGYERLQLFFLAHGLLLPFAANRFFYHHFIKKD